MDSPDRPAGVLTYSFDALLIEILQKSTIWGKIALPILMAFSSKYAVSLYENLAQFVNLNYRTCTAYGLEEFRSMLGVQPGQYKTFGELNKHVLKPVALEINALAPFGVSLLPVRQGKKVVQVKVGWWNKSEEEMLAASKEAQRSKIGRKARIAGNVEGVLAPMPSQEQLARKPHRLGLQSALNRPRVCRRLQLLRRWSHDELSSVKPLCLGQSGSHSRSMSTAAP